MAIAILILMLLALWHFISDAILLPSTRLSIRYRLFTLRDELRLLKYERNEEVPDAVFEQLEYSINHSIHNLSNITFGTILSVKKEVQKSPEFEKELIQRIDVVKENKIEEVRRIHRKLIMENVKALFVNSGGWLPYFLVLVILIVILLLIFGFVRRVKNYCMRGVLLFSYAKDEEYNAIPTLAV